MPIVEATRLRIPIFNAIEWGERLEVDLGRAADRVGAEYDGGEEEGEFEVHSFTGISPNDLLLLASRVLGKRASTISITGDHEVTVQVPDPDWIKVLGPVEHEYDRAIRRLVSQLANDPTWSEWWHSTRYRALWLQESHGSDEVNFDEDDLPGALFVRARVDLKILDEKPLDRAKVVSQAKHNLAIVLDKVAEFVGKEHPEFELT